MEVKVQYTGRLVVVVGGGVIVQGESEAQNGYIETPGKDLENKLATSHRDEAIQEGSGGNDRIARVPITSETDGTGLGKTRQNWCSVEAVV